MKSLLFLLLFATTSCFCQDKITNIKNAKVVNIYGNGKTVIGKLIINPTLVTNLKIIKYTPNVLENGIYITTIALDNKEKVPHFGTDITISTDKPMEDVEAMSGAKISVNYELNPERTVYRIIASQINRGRPGTDLLTFTIKSKEKIFCTITGVDGKL
ncbi:hypothetical protein [Pollutibacter soli]|uniref:hypothetical protein n=1 Tax=Pollutibacter soli TaxID=3034157 RepID=UPI003014181B